MSLARENFRVEVTVLACTAKGDMIVASWLFQSTNGDSEASMINIRNGIARE
jgi:hypothetical protein